MPTSRSKVYEAIDSERDYQDRLGADRKRDPSRVYPLSQAEMLTLIRHYLRGAESQWVLNPGEAVDGTQENIRKIAGICVQAMEKYGAPKRESK